MIEYKKFQLTNGLRVIVNEDTSTPLVAVNLLYHVGSKHENENKTGYAHLFEHLMFEGSGNIKHFDWELQKAGGQNNAYTSNDITNYYITLPAENIETALWLESDRMNELAFSDEKLAIQKNVVIEEYKQRYLNQPYGDIWLLMRPLAYKKHPYKWPTIGKNPKHIEEATIDDVKDFFYSFYAPNNAILSISGNIKPEKAEKLVIKWFGSIKSRILRKVNIFKEPEQNELREMVVKRPVPANLYFAAYHMPAHADKFFYGIDLISDILSNGDSSRFNQRLVKQKKVFSNLDCFVTGDMEEGLICVLGHLSEGTNMEQAADSVNNELEEIKSGQFSINELDKVKNKVDASLTFAKINILHKAMNLAQYELLGDVSMINDETSKYKKVSQGDIKNLANKYLRPDNCSVLKYYAE